MSFNIILNSTNLMNSNGVCNQYKYNFLGGSFDVPEGSQLALSSLTIPYSWFNISAFLGNNTFSYSIPISSGSQTITVIIPDGCYLISDLNNILSASLRQNNFYYYNISAPINCGFSNIPASQIIYPIQFSVNIVNYTNQITFQYIATNGNLSLGSSWVWANSSSYPTNAQLPTIPIPQQGGLNITQNTYGLGNILGFTNGTYPSSSTLYYGLATTQTTNIPTIINSYPLTINGNTLKTYTYNGSVSNLTITGANPSFSSIG